MAQNVDNLFNNKTFFTAAYSSKGVCNPKSKKCGCQSINKKKVKLPQKAYFNFIPMHQTHCLNYYCGKQIKIA